ncbi:MAG: hypothetical protein ACT4PU_08425 [Planctomycetota bacterium]
MTMSKRVLTRDGLSRLARKLARSFVEEAIIDGALDPAGKSEAEWNREVQMFLSRAMDPATPLVFRYDHTNDLLRLARRHAGQHELHLAALFYATWCEHWINSIVSAALRRRSFSDKDVASVIHETPLRGRIEWLPRLLGLRRIHPRHSSAVLKMAELRNGFVHYKWKGHDLDSDDQAELRRCVPTFDDTVRYLQRYFRTHVARRSNASIRRALP